MTVLSATSFLAPLPVGSLSTHPDFMLAGGEALGVATAEQGGFASLGSLPLAPRLGEAPGGYHPFSEEKMQRAREWFRGEAGDLKISPNRAEALGNKILSNLRCIDPITFKQALIQMGIAVTKFVGDEPYRLINNGPFSSNWFIYQSLRTMGLIPEAALVTDLDPNLRDDLLQEISTGEEKIIILDDCSYSGVALRAADVFRIDGWSRAPIDGSRVFVGLVAATERSRARVFNYSASYYIGLQIDRLIDQFDNNEQKIVIRGSVCGDITPSTFMWYKLPDNLIIPLGLCGLKTMGLETDENGNQVLPSTKPLYYEILHPDLLASFPPHERHRLRIEIKNILEKEGPEGVTEHLQSKKY